MNPRSNSSKRVCDPEQVLYQIALKKIPKVGAITARNLISYCGGVQEVFKTSKRALLKIPGVGETLARNIRNPDILPSAEKELNHVLKHDIDVIFYLDPEYPKRLAHFPQSPIILYRKGNANLNALCALAVVGTRKPTEYGKFWCEAMIRDLSGLNVLIVSGLAYGIDIAAHRAALNHGLPTVGVLGSGMGRIYPQTHIPVSKRMLKRGGIITECDFNTGPDKENFPARNRIIAAMVDAVLVVESAERGGSIITAEYANAFHKDVFALPGRANDSCSKGCNTLIKSHKAHLVESAEDIVRLLGWEPQKDPGRIQRQIFVELTDEERLVFELIQKESEIHIDLLSLQSKLPLSLLATILLSLEFKGVVKSLPGKQYSKN